MHIAAATLGLEFINAVVPLLLFKSFSGAFDAQNRSAMQHASLDMRMKVGG
jgi:hypothetical protein